LTWAWALADLDEAGVAVEAEDAATGRGYVLRCPDGLGEDDDAGLGDGFEACEAVDDLGAEVSFCGFGGVGEDEVDVDDVFSRDAGDAGAGGFAVWGDRDALDEAEVDDVEGKLGVVAVAEGGADVVFGEHQC
jgi:hypothetical protein